MNTLPEKLQVNNRYAVVYKTGQQRYARRSVMDYLGHKRYSKDRIALVFSQRPVAGTTEIDLADIESIDAAPGMKIKVNEVLRPSSR